GSAFAARALFDRIVDTQAFKRQVLVYGAGPRASAVANLRRRTDRRGHALVGFVRAAGEEIAVPPGRLLSGEEHLWEICDRLSVDEIVVAMEDRRRDFPLDELLHCRLHGVDITDLVSFLERET